jgi:hypothetical protein
VANLLIGDLNDGQDPAITDSNDRYDKSGYAHEAFLAYAVCVSTNGALAPGIDYLISQPVPAIIVNFSGFDGDDPTCLGQNTQSRKVNDLFEDGQLFFKSAGNTAGSSTNCSVSSPGSAIGTFTVGATGVDSSSDSITISEVRTEGIASFSAYGGNLTEGLNRTIVDLTAYGSRKELFDKTGGYTYSASGTSFAAPTVAAAAAEYSTYFNSGFGSGFDLPSPGILFVNMLLMGDRQGQSGTLTSRFDSLWGAGRLRLRTYDAAGLDAPSQYLTGSVCVGNGLTSTVPLNSGAAIPATVNVVKAAIYFYDSRHELGTAIDDIDLKLRNVSTGGTVAFSTSSDDEKEFIRYDAPGSKTLALDIIGFDVTADGAGCGTNQMKVYYAVFYEDSARDDADGPTNPGGGTGVSDVVPE